MPIEKLLDFDPDLTEKTVRVLKAEQFFRLKTSLAAFHMPLSIQDRLRHLWEKEFLHHSVSSEDALIFFDESQCPLNWQDFFLYLNKTGVAEYAHPLYTQNFNDEPKVYAVRIVARRLKNEETDGDPFPQEGKYSFSYALDLQEALVKAAGELLERFPLTVYRNRSLITASVSDMRLQKKKIADPSLFHSFSEIQTVENPLYHFNENSVFRWVRGNSLMDWNETFIPAQLVFWNYRFRRAEPRLAEPTTNGAGGWTTQEGAILSGLKELIERDGVLAYWLNGIAPPKIQLDSICDMRLKQLLADCARYHILVSILNVTTDLAVPSFLAVLSDDTGKGPAVTVGAGSGWDVEKAIEHALLEALNVRFWLRRRMENEQAFQPTLVGQAESGLFRRASFWGRPEARDLIAFFLEGKDEAIADVFSTLPQFETERDQLIYLQRLFAGKGKNYEIFYHLPEQAVLKELGYVSAKVIVPALLPLYIHDVWRPEAKQRLVDIRAFFGWKDQGKINLIPHPFV